MKRRISLALVMMIALSGSAFAANSSVSAEASPTPDLLEVDHRLYQLGYRDSAVTGKLSDTMVNALRNFQIVNELEVSGAPDDDTVTLLMSAQAVSQKDYLAALAREYDQVGILEDGSQGAQVKRLQQKLKELGYFAGECDGVYGRATEEAVYRFQLANGLPETGIADGMVTLRLYEGTPLTWDGFLQDNCASVGESGSHVRRIQNWLRHKNLFSGECTGRYGEGTQMAVKRFQAEFGLEPSGDVDFATSRALFSNVSGMLEDIASIRIGESGPEVVELCADLTALGYPAHEEFGMQTELAVMQFQYLNGMEISGEANRAMQALMKNEDVRAYSDFDPAKHPLLLNAQQQLQISRQAGALLGRQADFAEPFDLVRYVYLRCGYPLMDGSQLPLVEIDDTDGLKGGQVIFLDTAEGELCGICTSDGAIIYVDESGYVVTRYLEMMDIRGMRACAVEELK